MRNQTWYVVALIGLMCLVRFGLGAIGYVSPIWLMEELGAPLAMNEQMPYIIRVWAIRDIVLAILVATSRAHTIRPLLIACIAIDLTDILSAQLSHADGLFNTADTQSLMLTAILALVPESIALFLVKRTGEEAKQ